jgi:hypothetical protein
MKANLITAVFATMISGWAMAEKVEPSMIECQGTTSEFTIRYTTSSKVGKPTLYTNEAGVQMFTMDVKTVDVPHGILAYNASNTEPGIAAVFSLIVPSIDLGDATDFIEFDTMATKTLSGELESPVSQQNEYFPVHCRASLAVF